MGVPSASAPFAAVGVVSATPPAPPAPPHDVRRAAPAAPPRAGSVEGAPPAFDPARAAVAGSATCDIAGLSHVDPLTCRAIKAQVTRIDWPAPGGAADASIGSAAGSILGRIPAAPINVAISILGERSVDCPMTGWDVDQGRQCESAQLQILYQDFEGQIGARLQANAAGSEAVDPATSP